MIKAMLQFFLVCISILMLSSCQRQLSYDYFMQHPDELQKEYSLCQTQTMSWCDEVVRAAEDFQSLVQKRSENPEAFALEIMKAQQQGDQQKVRILYAVVKATSVR